MVLNLDVRLLRLVALGTTGVLVAFLTVVPILASSGRKWARADFGETNMLHGTIKDKKRARVPALGSVSGGLYGIPNMAVRIRFDGDEVGRLLLFMGHEASFNALRIGEEVCVVVGQHPVTGQHCALEITPINSGSA